jgi:PAS domain S-box-containing protein
MTDQQIERLKQQIASMEESKQLTRQMSEERLSELSNLAAKLRSLNESSSPKALGQLPKILKGVFGDRQSGVIVADSEGKILLFNSAVQRMLGMDQIADASGNANLKFFKDDRSTALPPGFFAWKEFQVEGCHKLFFQHPHVRDGIWVQLQCASLMDESNMQAGVVAIMSDITEQVKIEQEIQHICDSLEQQITLIESARTELSQLADKLGNPDWSLGLGLPFADTVAPDRSKAEVLPAQKPLPAQERKGEIKVRPAAVESDQIPPLLVVDDFAVNRKLLVFQLQGLGYQIETARNGQEAVEMATIKEYGVVLMDLDMPIKDGLQATLEIRKLDRETRRHTPIVAMTSYNRDGDRERCLASGMDDYLHKGVTRKQLHEVIQRCMKDRATPPAKEEMPPEKIVVEDEINVQYLEGTYGKAQAAEIVSLFGGTVRTLMNCLRFALEEQELKDINHFAYSLKGPCASIGLNSMVVLLEGIIADAESSNWHKAGQRMQVLEARCRRVTQQLSSRGNIPEAPF